MTSDPAQLPLVGTDGALVPAADDPVSLAMARGETALARQDLAAGASAFRDVLTMSPANTRARVRLAVTLDRMGDVDGAFAELDRALATKSDSVPFLLARAALAGAHLRYTQAESDLRRALKLNDSNPETHLQLGILHCRRARWREAIEPLRRASELDPSLVAAYYHLGEAYNHVDQLELARRAFERAAELAPGNWRTFKGLGMVFDRLGRPVEAGEAYRRARDAQRS
jgi:Flp pilus assembly protein TadD